MVPRLMSMILVSALLVAHAAPAQMQGTGDDATVAGSPPGGLLFGAFHRHEAHVGTAH